MSLIDASSTPDGVVVTGCAAAPIPIPMGGPSPTTDRAAALCPPSSSLSHSLSLRCIKGGVDGMQNGRLLSPNDRALGEPLMIVVYPSPRRRERRAGPERARGDFRGAGASGMVYSFFIS